MALLKKDLENTISLLVSMFDAAPSAGLMTGFIERLEVNPSLSDFANDLTLSGEYKSIYSSNLTDTEFATRFATNILDGNTDTATLTEAIAFVQTLLEAGNSQGDAILVSVNALRAIDQSDAKWGQATKALQNKIEVAEYFSTTPFDKPIDLAALQAVIANVTADPDTVDDHKLLIDFPDEAYYLLPEEDHLTGTEGNNIFQAWIFDNENTLQSEDIIDGGLGSDLLIAEIDNSSVPSLSPQLNSIETIYFRALDLNDDQRVVINAENINGTSAFWSMSSLSDLLINNINSNSHETTLGWKNTKVEGINFETYFSSENISRPNEATGSTLFLEIIDLEGMRQGLGPFNDNPYSGIVFSVDELEVSIILEDPFHTSYQNMVEDLNLALINAGFTTLRASEGDTFSAINSSDGVAYEGTIVELRNSGPETLEGLGFIVEGILPGPSPHSALYTAPANEEPQLTQVDIVLDNVGSAASASNLIAGLDSSESDQAGIDVKGIQQFNIQVDRSSWIDSVRSTNNALEKIVFESISDAGSIQINELTDIREIDAGAMSGDVKLTIHLTEASIEKYIEFDDVFVFQLGANDGSLNLQVANTVVDHNDFELFIAAGPGNDTVVLSLGDSDGQQTVNKVNVSTGLGDDTVILSGRGGVILNTGLDNDYISIQNAGNNIINPGSGNNTLILSDDENANDVIVIDREFSKNTIVNFETIGSSADILQLGAFLNSHSGNYLSSEIIPETVTHADVTSDNILTANEIILLNGFTEDLNSGETFASLTANHLLLAINSSNTEGSDNYGNITEKTLIKGSEKYADYVVMIENEANEGEYKMFHLEGYWSNDFHRASLIGTIDAGSEMVGLSELNIEI